MSEAARLAEQFDRIDQHYAAILARYDHLLTAKSDDPEWREELERERERLRRDRAEVRRSRAQARELGA